MAKLGLVLVLVLLCFVLDAGANAGASPAVSLIDEVDLLGFGVKAQGETSKEICTTALPASLEALHLQNMCLKATLPSDGKCSYSLDLAVSFKGASTPLYQAPIDLATLSACAGAANLTGSPIAQVCGPDVQVCVDFHEHGKASLRVGPDFVSGCPSIIIKDCKLPGAPGPLPPIPVELGCFSIGEDCAQYVGCEQCLKNGCGWCTAGMRDNFKCMAGTKDGPACNGECGGSQCNCDWHTDTCPEGDDEIKRNKLVLNDTEYAITLKQEKLEKLHSGIANGTIFGLLGKEYECLPSKKARGEKSGRAGITALVSVLTGLVGLGAGVALGKAGYWDIVFRRGGGDGGGLSDTGIYNRHDV